MLRISITGGIACGKSAVGALMAESGIAVCDADTVAHGLMRRGEEVFDKVVKLFGPRILGEDGEIDRRTLAGRVFRNSGELMSLNAIVHPEVKKAWDVWLVDQCALGAIAAAVIVPLLYEAGAGGGWDAVVCVSASERIQIQRLSDRGFCIEEARLRIAAQMPISAKISSADFVVVNDGGRELLKHQVAIVMERIMKKGRVV